MIIRDLYYKFKYVDEVTARGILDSMNNNLVVDYRGSDIGYPKVWSQIFVIDGFTIHITIHCDKKELNAGFKLITFTKLMVDELEIICSNFIKEKIWNRASKIYNKEGEKLEEERMLRKDIKLRFGGKLK